MTVAEMLDRMSARELDEWMAYAAIEPFGDEWRQTGMVAAVVANGNRDARKQPQPFAPEDFIPGGGRAAQRAMSDDEIARINDWKAAARAQRKARA
jgi:hypothetical protein